MATSEIQKLMESMGWSDGTFIPIASEENKILMTTMQELLDRKEKQTVSSQELGKRVIDLKEHATNAQQDIGHNLVIINYTIEL